MAYNDDVKTFTSSSGIAGGAPGTIPDLKQRSDGGSAFPTSQAVGQVVLTAGGMTLRDYFAAKALDGFMRWALDQPHFKDYDTAAKVAAGYAKSSYLIADAMLAAREVAQ